ncbi:MAG: glycoside hydrolase family 43 protein [Acidimicrobiales bacterium]|jgi:beta-xylosidase
MSGNGGVNAPVTAGGRGVGRRHVIAWSGALAAVVVAVGLVAVATSTSTSRASAAERPAGVRTPSGAGADVLVRQAVTAPPPDPHPIDPGTEVRAGVEHSDPFVMVAGGRYTLVTSGGPGTHPVNVPLVTSADFVHWSPPVDALPVLPAWAAVGYTWAPDVHQFGSRFALYFTAKVKGRTPGTECIGSAFATSPTGPYTARPAPFICQEDLGGSIDPRVFVDSDGTPWMLWKSDQNIGGASTPTTMWSQRLTPDGTRLLGRPAALLSPDEPWQGTIVEAPDMIEVDGAYWVVYSGNWFNTPAYAIGAARCAGPSGPCADTGDTPLLASDLQGLGPGEASVFSDRSGIWLLYTPSHSLTPKPDPPRPVYVTRIGFASTGPYLAAGPPPRAADLLTDSLLPPTP